MDIPNWYWSKGLHDAKVIDLFFESLDYDYTQRNPVRNCLTIQLNTENAMFDTSIKAIKFYNVRILQGNIDFEGWFWKDDTLVVTRKGFELEITLISYPNIKRIKISFESVIVEK